MKKADTFERLTPAQQELIVNELLDLMSAANRMPVIMALLENFVARREMSTVLGKLTSAVLPPLVEWLPGVSPAVLAQNREYRAWSTKALRERAAVIKPGMSPVMTERDLLDAEIPF